MKKNYMYRISTKAVDLRPEFCFREKQTGTILSQSDFFPQREFRNKNSRKK
jgi:hypothetical protein